ncbi:unnamed protein product [Cladocopium goreaui]|uniref:Uncharacterized protein n=1 Tax=Cladocopium goreaui TaxID=2562237 RepID=A0A9P1DP43_9DINO|nr:unnamed protein product [Cladocopium goreaui]
MQVLAWSFEALRVGKHPHQDPWARPFSAEYYPDRWRRAGTPLSGPYTYVLDGLQGDADFVAALFTLKRPLLE